MTRTVFRGGRVWDGTGVDAAAADVVIEEGRIVGVGPRQDGDVEVDATDRTLLPGLFDCHVHVCVSHVDLWKIAQRPFSYEFYEAARNLQATLAAGITSVRDAGGADAGAALEAIPRRYRLEYAAAADAGASLTDAVWPDGAGWAYRVRSVDGSDAFRAILTAGGA